MHHDIGATAEAYLDARRLQLVSRLYQIDWPDTLTSRRFLLVASAITMGGIGIWGMHFVGNRAIVLQHGDPDRQILYNPAFTAISFFLPILVLLFAFYTLGMPTRVRQFHVAIAGFFTGAAVCGMHYLGQYSVENYTCSYQVANVVGAAI